LRDWTTASCNHELNKPVEFRLPNKGASRWFGNPKDGGKHVGWAKVDE